MALFTFTTAARFCADGGSVKRDPPYGMLAPTVGANSFAIEIAHRQIVAWVKSGSGGGTFPGFHPGYGTESCNPVSGLDT
ncbi:hypothetical protein D9M72_577970 [compost metagenome]